jgi:hypothetical protein
MPEGMFAAPGAYVQAGLCLLLLGCQIVEGAQNASDDLLEPDPTYVAGPGRKLASGRRSRLGLDISQEGGPLVLSLLQRQTRTELTVTSLANGDECVIGPATDYRLYRGGAALRQGLVLYLEPGDAGGAATLRFADHACQPLGDGIEGASFPPYQAPEKLGFLVQSGTRLLYVDPYGGVMLVLGEQISKWGRHETGLALIDGGQLVVLDETLEQTARLGSQVTDFAIIGSGDDLYLAVADGGELVLFDSDYTELVRLDAQIGRWQVTAEHVWLIDGGELVVFDLALDEILRIGSGVTEFDLSPGYPADASFPGQPAAYIEGSKLYLLDDLEGSPELVAEDVCQLDRFSRDEQSWLSYLSPCAAGRLVLQEVGTDEQYVYAEGVTRVVDIESRDEGGFWVLYFSGSPDAQTLWVQAPDESPIQLGSNARTGPGVSGCLHAHPTTVWTDCEQDRCDLLQWYGGSAATVVARDVALAFYDGILANFDGATGDVMVWTSLPDEADLPSQERTQCVLSRYASGVPPQRFVRDDDDDFSEATHAAAFITDYDGHTGTLVVTEPHFGFYQEQPLPLAEPRRVGEGVPVGGFDFLSSYSGLAYLSEWNHTSRVGTLRAWNSELDSVARVSTDVSEFIEWPEAGIVYAVPTGDRAGVWYAEFK